MLTSKLFVRQLQLSLRRGVALRSLATAATVGLPALQIPPNLITAIQTKATESRGLLEYLRSHAKSPVSSVTVSTTLGGMRGAQMLVCETSAVDPNVGLAYRGYPVQDLIQRMTPQKTTGSTDTPSSESLLWLLLTGSIPDDEAIEGLRTTLVKRMKLPEHVANAIHALPIDAHPMTQFITGVAACQSESVFARMYATGSVPKQEHWKYALEDGLTLLAKLPALASLIYRRISTRPELSLTVPTPDMGMDWAGNIAYMMGFGDSEMATVMRMYMFLHADHEGGNVSAHAAHLVGSALSDPYLSYVASMAGLAGPLHGLANQQCLLFFRRMRDIFQAEKRAFTAETMREYIQTTILNQGQVVPGFGHAVLRVTDPRFTVQHKFARAMMPDNPLFQLLELCLEVVPPMLKATGKVASPYPNIDAHSGIILEHYGISEEKFFTVLFGVSRCMGIVSQLVWDRLLNLPIERPKSVTLNQLRDLVEKNNNASS